jgi:hypothetical protein
MTLSTRMAVMGGLLASGLMTACANPKLIASSTGGPGQIKMLYVDGNSQGVIKCDKADDGALSKCREMTVNMNAE